MPVPFLVYKCYTYKRKIGEVIMDKISVIIPTYNRAGTILRAVESVLSQTYSELEILVIDDGSTDGTEEVLNGISDERLRYVKLECNQGVANARNTGVHMAVGEWIAFQDSDDCWYEDKLWRQMEYAMKCPEYDMIYSRYLAKLEDGREILSPAEPLPQVMEGNMLNTLLERNVIGAPTMLIKREAFLGIGGFDVTYNSLEDWEFAIRFAKNHQIGFVGEPLMDVYMLTDGVSSRVGEYFESRCRMLATYREDMINAGVFDNVSMDILNRARNMNMLDSVYKLMVLHLA